MTAQDLWKEQGWPDLQEQDDLEEQKLLRKKQLIEAGIRTADSLLSLMNHPSYKMFMDAIEDMIKYRVAQLLVAKNDHELATYKGRCMELRAVSDMVSNAKSNRAGLAQQLEKVEDDLASLKQPLPEPNEEPS